METQEEQKTTNKEKYELKKKEKIAEKSVDLKKKQAKKIATKTGWIVLIIIILAGIIWIVAAWPETPESEIVSLNGMHWHPEIHIYVKGEEVEIPENIGIGAIHQSIHTHDDSDQGIIHMEFSGTVREREATLSQFFQNWGKDMRSFGENMRMTVNGQENTEYENYIMRDGDKIELWFD